jgi:Protein of unknown function (Hypoth_ymh)
LMHQMNQNTAISTFSNGPDCGITGRVSPAGGSRPRLVGRRSLTGDATADRTLKNRSRALRPFAEGCFAGIRNPAAHEHSETDWTEQKALECLAALSVLARWIDECEVQVQQG